MESEDMIIFDPLGELLKIAEEIKKEKEKEEQHELQARTNQKR